MSQDQDAETVARLEALEDNFRGDTANLIRSIDALIALDRKGVLVPHGIGGHARELLSAAAARLAAAEAENARMREALAFYADPKRYHGPPYRHDVTRDGGQIARAALEPRT